MKKALSFILLISFIFSLSAEVVYRDIPDTKIATDGASELKIDFNSDGKNEFTIMLENGGIIIKTSYIFVENGGSKVRAFSKDDIIHSSQGAVNTGNMRIQNAAGGNFTFGEEMFIGVSKRNFPVAGSTTFGWIRIKVEGNEDCTVYDYAFESHNNRPIVAGEKTNGMYASVKVIDKTSLTVSPNPTSDFLYINYGSFTNEVENVSIYSIKGELIRSFDNAQEVITMAEYRSGQYLVSIRFNNQAVETRRIVVE